MYSSRPKFDVLILKPVSIDVIKRKGAFEIAFHDVEGRRDDVLFFLKRLGDSTDQGGFARAEIAFEKDDVARLEIGGHLRPNDRVSSLFFVIRYIP
jgi:hypothetical protein